MGEGAMEASNLLEALLELAEHGQVEVRVLPASSARAEFSPTGSSAGRVGERVWVVLAPDDPPLHQAQVLAGALRRFRPQFLEDHFVPPGVRDFIERIGH